MTHIFFAILAIFSIVSAPQFAQGAINPVLPKSGNIHLGATTQYFYSTENFSNTGNSFNTIPNGGNFSELQTSFLGDYDLNSNFRLKSALAVSMVETKNNVYSKSNSYLDRILLGGEGWFLFRNMPLITGAEVTIPIFKPNLNGTEASGSEGVYAVQATAAIQPRWGSFRGHVMAGLNYLMENRGARMPWNVGASYGLKTGRIEGGLRGSQSVIKDSDSAQNIIKRSALINNAQGRSLRYFSVDPSYQEFYFSSRWGILKALDFSTDLGYAINGDSYAKGITAMVGIHYIMGSGSNRGSEARNTKPFNYKSNDTYEDSLFREADPSNLKKQLDETERALEE